MHTSTALLTPRDIKLSTQKMISQIPNHTKFFALVILRCRFFTTHIHTVCKLQKSLIFCAESFKISFGLLSVGTLALERVGGQKQFLIAAIQRYTFCSLFFSRYSMTEFLFCLYILQWYVEREAASFFRGNASLCKYINTWEY